MHEAPTTILPLSAPDFSIVGVGASAGGLDALRTFFSRLPDTPNIAFVVVVHLSPEHESHLVGLLQPYTRMPVRQVTRTVALEPNAVYVIPPNANLDSIDTHLRLTRLEVRRGERAPIDHFLRTLAATHGDAAIGVILTGAGSDGSLGLRQIKEGGGLTIAQDPQEAEFNSMPLSAIATGCVDLVLPLREMPDEILSYCATRPMPDSDGVVSDSADASWFAKILGELRLRTGHEFSMYTHQMLLHRLRRRMRLRHVDTLPRYFEVLHSLPAEPAALANDLLLNVTEFFRDPATYEALEERLLPEILDRKSSDGRVRIWTIGCSTGEEAYSLAMLLIELSTARGSQADIQVFASELSTSALQRARAGVYPHQVASTVSAERLERFFVQEQGFYRVRRELRDRVVFAAHDIFKDPPFFHLDLVVCRNMLRDLQPVVRQGVLRLFYYALEPEGLLLLGTNEKVDMPGLFITESSTSGLLRRTSGPRVAVEEMPASVQPFARLSGEREGTLVRSEALDAPAVFRAAISRYMPPSVLIDSDNEVVHFSSTVGRYVRIPGGELTRDILKLTHEPIRAHLQVALAETRRSSLSAESQMFDFLTGGSVRRMKIRVDPLVGAPGTALFLIVFDDNTWREPPAGPVEIDSRVTIAHLESELARVEGRLRDVVTASTAALNRDVSEHDAAQDMRGAIEDLESSREELQSLNEELLSLNTENVHRVDLLAQLSNDLQHLVESTGIATLVVDREQRILRFTPLFGQFLHLTDRDVGRPFTDFAHWPASLPDLASEVRRAIEQGARVDLETRSESGQWYLLRIHPYVTPLRGIEGAVLVLIDVTQLKRAEELLEQADKRKDEFLAVLAHELRNPLAPIISGIEVLRVRPDDPTIVRTVAATMERQTRQLVRLVDDLLEVSRITSGKYALQTCAVSIDEVVRDALAAVRPMLQSLNHELTVSVPQQPLIVIGDATRLTQVLVNLLTNAARYTSEGGQIGLDVRADSDSVLVNISDNGKGISVEDLEHVFDMFYQSSGVDAVHKGGLGIGLTLAKALVDMHHGTVNAQSAGVGKGSVFTVRLPLAIDTAIESPALPRLSERPAGADRVLIVDDNEDAAETLCQLIKTLGDREVKSVSSGRQALQMGAQMRPDIVLLDLGMPEMDGFEVARRMRREPWGKDCMLVALTGWGQEQHRRRSSEAGFDCHVTKPADAATLRAVFDAAAARQRVTAASVTAEVVNT